MLNKHFLNTQVSEKLVSNVPVGPYLHKASPTTVPLFRKCAWPSGTVLRLAFGPCFIMKYGRKLTPDLPLQKHLPTQPPSLLLKSDPSARPRFSVFCPPHFYFLGGKTCSVMVPPNWWGFCTLKEVPFFLWEELRKREGRSCTPGEGRSN